MGVTTLKRKARRNSARAEVRAQKLKLLNKKPVIKKVDIEELKKAQGGSTVVDKAVKEVKKVVEKVTGSEE